MLPKFAPCVIFTFQSPDGKTVMTAPENDDEVAAAALLRDKHGWTRIAKSPGVKIHIGGQDYYIFLQDVRNGDALLKQALGGE